MKKILFQTDLGDIRGYGWDPEAEYSESWLGTGAGGQQVPQSVGAVFYG